MNLDDLIVQDNNIDIDKYISFREEVKKHMEYPEWLGDFSKEDLVSLLDNDAKIWIYYDNKEPICSMMIIPAREKDLVKFSLDLDYKEVIDYGPMFVNPKYWGKGLQQQMLEKLNNYCLNEGYKYAVGTIHPDNKYSINNLEKNGFEYKGNREFSRGMRNIYLKKLEGNK